MAVIKKLRRAKKEAASAEKPSVVKTHLRKMIIMPEMISSIVGMCQDLSPLVAQCCLL